eukprot:Pompholyxophrys_punicea_v1_NODE_1652_length_605_cov_2.974545.p1 type:complete len:158 gc:universal NODE_1652_length_605_cov_2.974545:83-556(+)
MLLSWLPMSRNMVLLYRGTRDGFEGSAFHSKCDGHVNTLTLVRTTDNDVHGGFTPLPWNSNQVVVAGTGQSFVFTLVSRSSNVTAPARQRCLNPKEEIYGCKCCGPRFGQQQNQTLYINNNSTVSRYTGAGDYEAAGPAAKTVTFRLAEIEVYELVA